MLTINGAGDGEFIVSDTDEFRTRRANASATLLNMSGAFGGASVQIGFTAEDGTFHFYSDLYVSAISLTVTTGIGGQLVVKVTGSTGTTNLTLSELVV